MQLVCPLSRVSITTDIVLIVASSALEPKGATSGIEISQNYVYALATRHKSKESLDFVMVCSISFTMMFIILFIRVLPYIM